MAARPRRRRAPGRDGPRHGGPLARPPGLGRRRARHPPRRRDPRDCQGPGARRDHEHRDHPAAARRRPQHRRPAAARRTTSIAVPPRCGPRGARRRTHPSAAPPGYRAATRPRPRPGDQSPGPSRPRRADAGRFDRTSVRRWPAGGGPDDHRRDGRPGIEVEP
jgi:hypothetical protein